jgi:rhamnose utilization protein RhaD (predicted bifunctional aldolase and dehydrogenase)
VDKALVDLIRISNTVGKDTALVQGRGGNTSVKTPDGKYMYIKASGTALKDMNEQAGWRRMRLDLVRAIIKDKSIAELDIRSKENEVANRLLLACDDETQGSARPSIEANLHAFLDNCVIHLHPVAVLSYACARNGRAELDKLFKNMKSAPLWVPYADPGFKLAGKVTGLISDYQSRFSQNPVVLFLQKHGLIVSADNADAALRLLRKVINRCSENLDWPKAISTEPVTQQTIADTKLCIRRAFYEATGQYADVSHFHDDTITAFWKRKDAPELLSLSALTPDELLYAHGPAVWMENCVPEDIACIVTEKIEKGEKPPAAFLVKDAGLFIAGTKKIAPTIRDIVKSSFVIRANASRMGGILTLSKAERDIINQWETDV